MCTKGYEIETDLHSSFNYKMRVGKGEKKEEINAEYELLEEKNIKLC